MRAFLISAVFSGLTHQAHGPAIGMEHPSDVNVWEGVWGWRMGGGVDGSVCCLPPPPSGGASSLCSCVVGLFLSHSSGFAFARLQQVAFYKDQMRRQIKKASGTKNQCVARYVIWYASGWSFGLIYRVCAHPHSPTSLSARLGHNFIEWNTNEYLDMDVYALSSSSFCFGRFKIKNWHSSQGHRTP